MVTSRNCYKTSTFDPHKQVDLIEYYPKLLSLARRFVYIYWVPCWYGQEKDIAEDVAQETMRRIIERIHKAAQGKAKPVDSIEDMMAVIARNYALDLRRRDRRIVRLSNNPEYGMETNMCELEDTLETATEHLYHESLFLQIAREIKQFPCKQRRAILIDLANRMSFNSQPTPLQSAFLTVGIALQDYQQPLPENPVERARHASLLSLAYKRIARLSIIYELFSVA